MSATEWDSTIGRATALYEFKYKLEKYVSAKKSSLLNLKHVGHPGKIVW